MNYLLQILQMVLVISLVIGIVWLFGKRAGRRAGYRWRKNLWLLLAVCLLFPFPLLNSGTADFIKGVEIELEIPEQLPVGSPVDESVEMTQQVSGMAVEENQHAESIVEPVQPDSANPVRNEGYIMPQGAKASAENGISLAGCIALVWCTGAVILLAVRVWQYRSLKKRYFAETVPCEDSTILECRDRLCREFGIRELIPIRVMEQASNTVNSPMLFGYIHTNLLIPNQHYDARELESIMRHELTHYRSKDLWYKLFMMIVCEIYWFNPIFLLMKKMAFHDVEFVCDEKVTASLDLDAKKEYSSTILKTMAGAGGSNLVFATKFAGSKKSAKERFENIFSIHNRKIGIGILSVLLLVLVVGTVFISVRVAKEDEEPAAADNEAVASIEETGEAGESDVVVEETVEQEVLPEERETIKIDANILPENLDAVPAELSAQYPNYEIDAVTPASYYWDEGTDGPAPIVYQAWDTKVSALAEAGKIADITDALAERGWLEQIDDAAKVMVSDENGRVYGIPSSMSYAYGIMANVKLFEEAGLVDEAGMPVMPATWEELAQTAVAIKNATGQAGICWNVGSDSYIGSVHFINMAWNFGVTDLITAEADGSYKTHLDSDAAIAAMEYIKDLKWEYGVLTEDPTKETYMSGYERLANGTAAMYIGANDALSLPISCGMDPANLALGAIPAGPGGEQYSYYATDVFVFSADAKPEEIEVALSLLEMLGLGPVPNDAAKNRIQNKIESANAQGGPAIREIPVWKNAELLEYEQSVIAELGNTDQALYQSYFDSVLSPGNRKSPDTIANSELHMELANVLEMVVTDPNADVAQLMKTANEYWQISVDHYTAQ